MASNANASVRAWMDSLEKAIFRSWSARLAKPTKLIYASPDKSLATGIKSAGLFSLSLIRDGALPLM
jgi:hypothetical protein